MPIPRTGKAQRKIESRLRPLAAPSLAQVHAHRELIDRRSRRTSENHGCFPTNDSPSKEFPPRIFGAKAMSCTVRKSSGNADCVFVTMGVSDPCLKLFLSLGEVC